MNIKHLKPFCDGCGILGHIGLDIVKWKEGYLIELKECSVHARPVETDENVLPWRNYRDANRDQREPRVSKRVA